MALAFELLPPPSSQLLPQGSLSSRARVVSGVPPRLRLAAPSGPIATIAAPQASRAGARVQQPRCGWGTALATLSGAAVAVVRRSTKHRSRHASAVIRCAGGIVIRTAEFGDLPDAANLCVRSIRWTLGPFDELTEDDLNYIAAIEIGSYSNYLTPSADRSTFLVASEEEEAEADEGFSLLSVFGMKEKSRKVAGCVGCEVTRFSLADGSRVDSSVSLADVVQRPVIFDLAVDPAYRGRGIARKLVAKLEDTIKEWGYKESTLLVEATNFQAVTVYLRLGYSVEAIRPNEPIPYLEVDGETRSFEKRKGLVLLMSKKLA